MIASNTEISATNDVETISLANSTVVCDEMLNFRYKSMKIKT